MRTPKSKSAPVGVIGKVLRILELLNHSPNGLQLREIAIKTEINKSTAHRFLSHLEAEGYLFQSENVNLPKEQVYSTIEKNVILQPIAAGSKIVLKN